MAAHSENWLEHFAGLRHAGARTRDALLQRGHVLTLPKGAHVFDAGQVPANYLLLLEGSVKVFRVTQNGRAIVLYRIGPGESCMLTTACIAAGETYPADAVAETPIRAVAIARPLFDSLVAQSAEFRGFVFESFGRRVADLFRVVEDIAFVRMDVRVSQKLLALAPGTDELAITQAELADELGTAREVVSRTLSELHRRGWIDSARGRIVVRDRAALDAFVRDNRAAGDP